MKIQGPNPYIQLYRQNQQTVKNEKTNKPKDDQLKISNEAINLQRNEGHLVRREKVSEIKSLVQSGEYRINYEKTAQKLLEFWKSR
ncbi:MAG TPA: flagellar biosynthesis anti-sigma factor FlgM [Pseudogracilibacillus sp.]|nr:flagellar biosynthesis anti-sigma factor FlgM [Pseudogracilibacillus sp.]